MTPNKEQLEYFFGPKCEDYDKDCATCFVYDLVKPENKVTRLEVIHRGKGYEYMNHNVDDAWVSIQDKGRTMKVFINESI